MTEEANKRIGDYQILDELGSGGMGRVWRVRNVITDRIEAMKVLLPDLAGRQELAARFQREIKLMASLNHPNIAALRTAFTADNQLYMVMEYVEGTNLADKLEKGPIPVGDAVNYTSQVLSAVSYAHQQHIIHRDIKPANMMLTPQGVIKLMDFGIARAGEERSLTMTGTTMGSLSYMSPEQVKGEATDARSDLYSVGVSLYEFVTGQRPFTATSDYSIMAAHVKEAPKPPVELHPGLPAALNEIILMAIAKDPAQRFQTADAFRNALSSVPVSAPTPAMLEATTVESMAALPSVPAAPTATPAAPVAALKSPTPPPPNPTPTPMPPPPQGSGHRGLYMTLGALIVLAGLVVAGIYVPRISKTHAKAPDANSVEQTADTAMPSATPSEAQPSQPAPSDAPAAGAMSSDSSQPPAEPTTTTASVDNSSAMQSAAAPAAPEMEKPVQSNLAPAKPSHSHAKKVMAQSGGMSGDAGTPPQGDSGMAAPEASNSSAQLDELEQTVDQLSNRAAAVNSGLDRLQQEQSASGYGLRGDMVERQASLKANLFKAEEAMQHHDAVRAKKYADMAGKDLEVLERFLGH
jgi:eukaryotic-like serine/threonine-protein kinase